MAFSKALVSREAALNPFRSSPYIGMYGKMSRSLFLSFCIGLVYQVVAGH
jgi:hypothetical protein